MVASTNTPIKYIGVWSLKYIMQRFFTVLQGDFFHNKAFLVGMVQQLVTERNVMVKEQFADCIIEIISTQRGLVLDNLVFEAKLPAASIFVLIETARNIHSHPKSHTTK